MNTPFEIERKFLIEYPKDVDLLSVPGCEKTEIAQTYLVRGADGAERRVRKRGKEGSYVYTYTEKVFLSAMRRIEREREISQEEYEQLLSEAEPTMRTLHKYRYCIPYAGQMCEVDVYPEITQWAVLEIEISDETQEIVLPDFVVTVREVTGEKQYSNKYLARRTANE